VDNIKMDLRVIGWSGVDWIDMAQERDQWMTLVKAVMNLQVLYSAGKFLNGYTIFIISRRAQLREVGYDIIVFKGHVRVSLPCCNYSSASIYFK
jgi:hypothetical protein